MNLNNNEKKIVDYFETTLKKFGHTPKGVDWNSDISQNLRFQQLVKVIDANNPFSILDYGCGYGALLDYLLDNKYSFSKYIGYDISEKMIEASKQQYSSIETASFITNLDEKTNVDYAVASGVFNMKLETPDDAWSEYVISCLNEINRITEKGFAITFLTKYSDQDKMRGDLYYADPCFLFDYSKRNYAKNVAILHDYGVYDFTLIVRKDI